MDVDLMFRGATERLRAEHADIDEGRMLSANGLKCTGGFFAYPELLDAPDGKYRLQFESNPIGYITERAGGKASTGKERILDVEPISISQRVPTYLGNKDLVSEFEGLSGSSTGLS